MPETIPASPVLSRRQFAALSFFAAAGAAVGFTPSPALARTLHQSEPVSPFNWKALPGDGAKVASEQGGNALVIVSTGQAMLVDCKNAPFGFALRRDASSQGGTLTTVVNTHHHGDHTGGNGAFTNNLTLIAQKNADARIRSQVIRYGEILASVPRDNELHDDARRLLGLLERDGANAWAPTRTIDRIETAQIGAERVIIEYIGPAHTDNDLAVFIPGKNILHTGDVVFHRLFPFVDPNGGSDIDGWIAACDRLMKIGNKDTVVVPGHGEITDRDGIAEQQKFLVDLREFVLKQIKAGKTVEEVTEMTPPGYEDYGFGQIRPRTMSGAYTVLKRKM
jgi:glyoxylase-like metal-dependent hydrolase (beta-lactamase superfamily II)